MPLALLNVISGLVYAVAMPFVALATVYVYFDMRVRDELAREARESAPGRDRVRSGERTRRLTDAQEGTRRPCEL